MSAFSSSAVEPSVDEIKPYLTFNGTTRQALEFYRDSLGGKLDVMTFEGTPMAGDMSADAVKLVMHGTLEINSKCRIMASDSLDNSVIMGNSIAMSLNFTTDSQITSAYEKLSADGNVSQPLGDQFWGGKFAQFTDKFGVLWMFHLELPSKDKEGEESDAKKRKLETGEASNDENVSGNEGIFLQPYLLFDNTCLEVLTYVKGIVGGEYESMSFKGSPLDTNLSEEEKEKLIMHSTLKLNGGKCTLMASDCGSHSTPVKPGTNVALSVLFTAEPALNLAYDEVSATGKVVEPLKKMFWGALFGHSVDKHGLVWYFVGPHATCVKDEDGKDKA